MTNISDIMNSVKKTMEAEELAGVKELIIDREKMTKNKPTKKNITLPELKEKVSACRRCSLAETNTNYVFGDGNPKADLMFIGEAPGREEDKQGLPFVGRAGKLLTMIIEAIGLKREDVFIGNILKCRPPDNRNPLPDEIAMCSPYLIKQVELIKPKVIFALGKFAAQTLLNTETPISKLRGKFYDYQGIKLMPTYHPAYLLRNPGAKKDVWIDMQVVAKELGLKVPRHKKQP